jgi:hypothetical protein
MYTMRIRRAQGTCDAALNTVYESIIVARIMNAACTWWGFTTVYVILLYCDVDNYVMVWISY